MANRAYLYSLSNRPTSYADRPETISGLSEWPYAIPFTYRVLLSGDPQICASLLSDGFDEEPVDEKTKLHALSGDFETGFARLRKFFAILRPLVVGRCPVLTANLDETLAFLESHCDRYLLLETVELDTMTTSAEDELWGCVQAERGECRRVGAAIDALPEDVVEAGARLMRAAQERADPPFDAFYGLRFDDDHDNVRDSLTEYPLGLEWAEDLYFSLWNRAEFEANANQADDQD